MFHKGAKHSVNVEEIFKTKLIVIFLKFNIFIAYENRIVWYAKAV